MNCQRCDSVHDSVGQIRLLGFIPVILCDDCELDWMKFSRIQKDHLKWEQLNSTRVIIEKMAEGNYNQDIINHYLETTEDQYKLELKILAVTKQFLDDPT